MGWLFSQDMTKAEQVAELVKGWEKDGKGLKFLDHSVRGNVLFGVGQPFDNGVEKIEDRWIFVVLLGKQRGFGWGYKDMDESMGPFNYNCPLKYLKMAPTVRCETWRAGVLAHHEKRRQRSKQTLAEGTRFRFAPGFKWAGGSLDAEEATILGKSGRGYRAQFGFSTIKVMRRHIGEIL